MGKTKDVISPEELMRVIGTAACPRVVDVRRAEVFEAAAERIPGALWRDHRGAEAWAGSTGGAGEIVVYCVHGHQVSRTAVALLRSRGFAARRLAGGIEAHREAGGTLLRKPPDLQERQETPGRWVAAVGADPDCLARAWFVRRFLDPAAVFHFVEADWVDEVAAELGGRPLRPARDSNCRLDDFFLRYSFGDDALRALAGCIGTAGQDRENRRRPTPGLLAMLEGLTAVFGDDTARVSAALPVLDAFYAGCRRRSLEHATLETS